MDKGVPEHDRLVDEAIDLVIRLQSDPENPVTIEMVRVWRARSPEHERIWQLMARVHGATGKILTDRRKAERRKSLGLTRRNLVIGGIIGLSATATGSFFIPDILLRGRADYVTGTGEIRRIPLPDGSIATLGPDSAVALDYRQEQRRIELLAGMSFFDVAKNPRRPFLVQTGELVSTALGTAFDVSSDAGVITVSVDHGLVEVRAPDLPLAAGSRLEADDWMTFDTSSGIVDRGKREPGQVGMWRDRLLIADREAVTALVARIGRWIPGRIITADPYIGQQRVSGIFDLSNPLRALEAVVHPAGGRVRQISSFVTVISPV
jgi:transmembrane sensor